jgi:hypothetical protein
MLLSITTFSILTPNIKGLICDTSINVTQHKRHSAKQHCHYAKCRVLLNVMLNFDTLSAVMLNVVMLSLTRPQYELPKVKLSIVQPL